MVGVAAKILAPIIVTEGDMTAYAGPQNYRLVVRGLNGGPNTGVSSGIGRKPVNVS